MRTSFTIFNIFRLFRRKQGTAEDNARTREGRSKRVEHESEVFRL